MPRCEAAGAWSVGDIGRFAGSLEEPEIMGSVFSFCYRKSDSFRKWRVDRAQIIAQAVAINVTNGYVSMKYFGYETLPDDCGPTARHCASFRYSYADYRRTPIETAFEVYQNVQY
jgi:hypothetical protein